MILNGNFALFNFLQVIEVRFPTRALYFCLHSLWTGSGFHIASYPVGTGVKQQEREAEHSLACSA
jgi:hypothetical protein